MRSHTVVTLLIASFAAIAGSQSIDPSSVPKSTRTAWCQDQKRTCPLLCIQDTGSGSTAANDCDVDTLGWNCVCAKTGVTPNISEYSLTMPFHICQEYGNQCVAQCGQNNNCANNCRTQYKCGAQNPTTVNSTSSSSTRTSTGSSSSSTGQFDSFGGSGTGNSKGAGAALHVGQHYGIGLIGLGFAAGFAYVL